MSRYRVSRQYRVLGLATLIFFCYAIVNTFLNLKNSGGVELWFVFAILFFLFVIIVNIYYQTYKVCIDENGIVVYNFLRKKVIKFCEIVRIQYSGINDHIVTIITTKDKIKIRCNDMLEKRVELYLELVEIAKPFK